MRRSLLTATAAIALLLTAVTAYAFDDDHVGEGLSSSGASPALPDTGLVDLIDAPTSRASDFLVPPGFPTSQTTGVPAGTRLTPSNGDIVIKKDGTVLDKLDITGCVTIRANNVSIRRTRITCAGKPGIWPIRVYDGFKNTRVSDTEIDGAGIASVAVLGNNYSLTRVNVHNSTDGPRLGSGTSIVDSYVHDLARRPGTHNDTLQTIGGSNIVVRGNTLLAYKPSTDDPMNGAIQTGRLLTPLSNMLVEDNYLDGGTYTVRGGSGPRDGALITNYTFRNNTFGRNCGFGPVNGVDSPVTWEPNNRWIDTPDQPLTTDSKTNKKRCTKTNQARVKQDQPATSAPPESAVDVEKDTDVGGL